MGVGVEAEVTNCALAIVGNVGGDPGGKLQVVHPLHLFSVFAIPITDLHPPHSFSLLAWQEGQNPRVRQENISRRSAWQSGQRMRANPQRGLPQSR